MCRITVVFVFIVSLLVVVIVLLLNTRLVFVVGFPFRRFLRIRLGTIIVILSRGAVFLHIDILRNNFTGVDWKLIARKMVARGRILFLQTGLQDWRDGMAMTLLEMRIRSHGAPGIGPKGGKVVGVVGGTGLTAIHHCLEYLYCSKESFCTKYSKESAVYLTTFTKDAHTSIITYIKEVTVGLE